MTMRFERNDVPSPSTGRPAQDVQLCGWCFKPLRFPGQSDLGLLASSDENLAAALHESRAALGLEIHRPARQDVSSSLTRRGGGASRSWSVTGSSGLVCRRLRRARSEGSLVPAILRRGTGTGSKSDSSKLSIGEAATIGRAEGTPADCEFGWMGYHYWDRKPFAGPGYVCLMCGREKP